MPLHFRKGEYGRVVFSGMQFLDDSVVAGMLGNAHCLSLKSCYSCEHAHERTAQQALLVHHVSHHMLQCYVSVSLIDGVL